MLPLDSPRWAELEHCYGSAANIPALLKRLENFPASTGQSEPWFTLWSSLCHQGDIYPASIAAVPHIIRVLALDPLRADSNFFQLPACIEIARAKANVLPPPDLKTSYFEAMKRIPGLVAAAAERDWDESLLRCILSALAASKGFSEIADACLELNPEIVIEFQEWIENR